MPPLKEILFPWTRFNSYQKRKYDFSEVSADAISEFHRQAELYLEGTMKLALAADSRATTSTNIFTAATIGSLAIAANLAAKDIANPVLIAPVVAAGVFLFAAAAFCGFASRPVNFYITGYEPDIFYDVATTELNMKRKSAEDVQVRIDYNKLCLAIAADTLRIGQALAALSSFAFLSTFSLLHR